MYAFGVLQAVQSAIPTASIAYDATPLAYLGFLALAALVGSALGTVMRAQRTHEAAAPRLRPVPRAA
jgi:hypothetical protein